MAREFGKMFGPLIFWWAGTLNGVSRSIGKPSILISTRPEISDALLSVANCEKNLDGDSISRTPVQPFTEFIQNNPCKSADISLSDTLYLHRRLDLPRAVGPDARKMLELDLQTGAAIDTSDAGDVLTAWFWSNESDSPTLTANLIVIKRKLFDDLQKVYLENGKKLKRLFIEADGQSFDIMKNLSLPELQQKRKRQWWFAVGLAATVVLGVFATGIHLLSKQSAALAKLDQSIQFETTNAKGKRQQIDAQNTLIAQISSLRNVKLKDPSVHQMLRSITKVLPDTAWLSELRMNKDRLVLTGFAKSAVDLIKPIEALKQVKSAEFTSSITRAKRENAERFTMAVTLNSTGVGS